MEAPILHILIDQDGIPRTINGNVKVKMIVQKHIRGGVSLSDVADHYNIMMSDVHAALAYYFDNKDKMDAEIARKEQRLEEIGISNDDMRASIERKRAQKQADNE